MKKIYQQSIWIIVGVVLFLMVFIFSIIKIYSIATSEAKKNHQQKQLEMANATVTGIETILSQIIEDMRLLSIYPDLNSLDSAKKLDRIEYIFNFQKQNIIKSIFISDSSGNIRILGGSEIPEWTESFVIDLIESSVNINESNEPLVSKVNPFKLGGKSNFVFIIILPVNEKMISINKESKFGITKNYIGYLLSFDLLMKKFVEPLNLTTNDFTWIIDGDGSLIYHPNHREMLLNSIKRVDDNCVSCHPDFSVQQQMLVNLNSTAEYYIIGEPDKIMAYASVSVGDEKWIFAVSSYLPNIIQDLAKNYTLFFLMVGLVLFVSLAIGIILFIINSKRIKAEQSKIHFEKLQSIQTQLEHADKLASLGELISSVAHEINTPASIISVHADALKIGEIDKEQLSEEIKIINDQIRRIGNYTKRLLNFSARIPFTPEPTDIPELMESAILMLQYPLNKKTISLIKSYESNLERVDVDKSQLEQVFINLLKNSIESIEQSGTIIINIFFSSENIKFAREKINGIVIEIEDTGIGINESDIKNIFKPFFSTKSGIRGTGLGLSISKTIIDRHSGSITVNSKPGNGTSMKIFIPQTIPEQ